MVLDSCGLILHFLECIWMVWNVLDSLAWSWTFFPAQVVCASFWTSCCDWCRLCQTFRSCGSDYCLRRRPCQALSNIWTTFPWSSCPSQIGNSKNKLVTKSQATFQILFGPTTLVIVKCTKLRMSSLVSRMVGWFMKTFFCIDSDVRNTRVVFGGYIETFPLVDTDTNLINTSITFALFGSQVSAKK